MTDTQKKPLWKNELVWLFLITSGLFAILYSKFILGGYAYVFTDTGADTMQITHNIHKFSVIQTKAGKLINMINICNLVDQSVIAFPHQVHAMAFFTCTLHSNYNLCSLFPLPDKFGDHVYRILKICAHTYHTVTICLFHSIHR